mgnify:FL=1
MKNDKAVIHSKSKSALDITDENIGENTNKNNTVVLDPALNSSIQNPHANNDKTVIDGRTTTANKSMERQSA